MYSVCMALLPNIILQFLNQYFLENYMQRANHVTDLWTLQVSFYLT